MADTKSLIELRKKIKAKKPSFARKDSHKKTSLGTKWRKPKGLQNKRRKHLKGHQKTVRQGYRSPFAVRGLHKSGLEIVNVRSLNLENINPKTQAIELSATLGMKTKTAIIKEAQKKNITIVNIKNPAVFLKQV